MKLASKHTSCKLLTTLLLILVSVADCWAQDKVADFYVQAGKTNLAALWHAPQIYYVGAPEPWGTFPEPLGFIGSNYQRFYIHYTSVIKDAQNPYRYVVKGKTRVNNNICSFTGTITVAQVKRNLEPHPEYPKYKYGYLICNVDFKEDPNQPGSGVIKGRLTTYWYLNQMNQFAYDTLIPEDGFSNNQCVARWTSYKTGNSKPCHWGDFRIPKSGDLDHGVGEFYVNDKYINDGWRNYMQAKLADDGKAAGKKALAEENRRWWK